MSAFVNLQLLMVSAALPQALRHVTPGAAPVHRSSCVMSGDREVTRRAATVQGLLSVGAVGASAFLLEGPAVAQGTNPANNYYFPMAKYRYLPRIDRAYHALYDSTDAMLEAKDWDTLQQMFDYADDATTAMRLFANAVEGSRSSKSKKKSDRQKELYALTADYENGLKKMSKGMKAKSTKDTSTAIAETLVAMTKYQKVADIEGDKALPPDVPKDQQKYIAVFKGGGYRKKQPPGPEATAPAQ